MSGQKTIRIGLQADTEGAQSGATSARMTRHE
jgi:hypothetical protein